MTTMRSAPLFLGLIFAACASARPPAPATPADEPTALVPCARPVDAPYTGPTSAPPPAASASAAKAPTPVATSTAPAAKAPPRVAWNPGSRAAAPAPTGPCGGRTNPCPLQKWMRQNMAPALAAKDGAALAKALEKTITFVPDKSWTNWTTISQTAAAAAKTGDITNARVSCTGCHAAFKAQYKEKFRTRAIK